jgi:hypothetical protein
LAEVDGGVFSVVSAGGALAAVAGATLGISSFGVAEGLTVRLGLVSESGAEAVEVAGFRADREDVGVGDASGAGVAAVVRLRPRNSLWKKPGFFGFGVATSSATGACASVIAGFGVGFGAGVDLAEEVGLSTDEAGLSGALRSAGFFSSAFFSTAEAGA